VLAILIKVMRKVHLQWLNTIPLKINNFTSVRHFDQSCGKCIFNDCITLPLKNEWVDVIICVIYQKNNCSQAVGQSFSIALAAGSDQKGSDIPETLFILKVIDRRTANRRA
jgi:hypothetical protein